MAKKILLLFIIGVWILCPALVYAATDSQNLTINATVNAKAKLTLTPSTINFPDTDPDTTPIPADNTVGVTAKVRTGSASTATLTVLANGDLTSGSDTIPISKVHWTGSGSGFVTSGTLDKTTSQAVASWTGSGVYTGTLYFTMDNSWDYPTGTYSATATYLLTAP